MQMMRAQVPTKESPTADAVRVTVREEEVLRLLSLGKCNKEIAAAINISPRTVKFHMTNLLAKFGVTSRLELLVALSHSAKLALLLGCLPGYLYLSTVVSSAPLTL